MFFSAMMGKRSCDSDDVRNPGFGASVDTADGVQSEFEKDFSVQLQYKVILRYAIFWILILDF